jgi:sulfur carrier protein ThiS
MWSNKYVGIPFVSGGRDYTGIDCWGLVRLVYKEQFNIELPSFTDEYFDNDTQRMQELISQYKEGWEQVDAPSEGTVVLFRVLGAETHLGVAISSTHFLHAMEDQSSAVEAFSGTNWKNRIVGYFKYKEKGAVVLNAVPHPLRTERHTVPIPPGTKLSDLAKWITSNWEVPAEIKSKITIMVNGRVIPEHEWETTILQDTDTVEYRAVPGKSAMRLILTVIVAYIAIQTGYYAVGVESMWGAGTAASAMTATQAATAFAVSAGVQMVGAALINAIAPIRPPAGPNDPGSSERQLMIEGAPNRATPYGAIPVVLGKVKIIPPLGANNFITYENNRDSYLSMLLVWGYGPLEVYRDTLKIGNVDIDDYAMQAQPVTLDRKTEPTAEEQKAFDNIYGSDITYIQKNQEFVCAGNPEAAVTPGPWIEVASSEGAAEVSVAIHYPQGLRKIAIKGDGAGNSYATPVTHELQYKIGNSDWLVWETVTNGGPIYGMREVEIGGGITGTYQEYGVIGNEAFQIDAFTITKTLRNLNTNEIVQIRARRITGTDTEANENYRFSHASVLLAVTFTKNDKPAKDPKNCKIAKTALKLVAGKELNGQLEGINAIVQTYTNSWNGTNWVLAATNNPADLFRYILEHPANPQRVLSSEVSDKINLASLQHWHAYCVAKGFQYNSVLGAQRSVLEVLRDICAAGRASPAMVDGKWTVIIDEPKDNIVQHFTPHNSWGFEGTIALPKMPDGLRVQYYDEDQDYQEAEIIVYQPDKDLTNSELFESIQLPGVTKKSSVIDHARWHMAQAKLRREVYTINTDIEYIVCNRGDRVKVMHDVPMWGLGSGRIKNRLSDTILELDELVPMETGKDYTLRIRSSTGGSSERTIKKSFQITAVQRSSNLVTVTLAQGPHPIQVGDMLNVSTSVNAINLADAVVTKVTTNTIQYFLTGGTIQSTVATGNVSLANGTYGVVQVTSPLLEADASPSDLFLHGELHQEAQDLIILSIEPTGNKTARITMMDYGVTDTYNIFTDYLTLTSNTIFESQITLPPKMLVNSFAASDIPLITNIQSDDTVAVMISPGNYAYRIRVSYANANNIPKTVQSVECQYALDNTAGVLGAQSITVDYGVETVYIPNVLIGQDYKVRLRYISSDGKTGPWTNWVSHSVDGKTINYGEISSLLVQRSHKYLNITPVIGSLPNDFKYFEVRVFKDPGTGDFWDSTDPNIKTFTTTGTISVDLRQFARPRLSQQGVKYRIACRMVDTVNNYNSTSTLTNITLFSLV